MPAAQAGRAIAQAGRAIAPPGRPLAVEGAGRHRHHRHRQDDLQAGLPTIFRPERVVALRCDRTCLAIHRVVRRRDTIVTEQLDRSQALIKIKLAQS